MRREWAWVVALTIVVVVLLGPMLAYPLGFDHHLFVTVADTILHGGRPYVDAWEMKPVGIHYLFAGAIKLLGRSDRAIRVLDFWWQLATALAVYALGRRLRSPVAGLFAAAAYVCCYATASTFHSSAQCESFASLLAVGCVLAALHAESRRRLWVVSGALVVAAALLKTPLVLLVILPFLLATRNSQRLLVAAGFLGATLAALVWLGSMGVLREMYAITVLWNLDYGRVRYPWGPFFAVMGTGFGYPALALVPVAGMAGLVLPGKSGGRARWLLPVWTMIALAILVWQGKFFRYHAQPLFVPLCLGAGIAFAWVWERSGRQRIVIAAALLALLAATHVARRSAPSPLGAVHCGGVDEAAEYVRAHTAATDRIWVWGTAAKLYWYADRRPACRFFWNPPLVAQWSPRRWLDEAERSVKEGRARLIVVQHNDTAYLQAGFGYDRDSSEALQRKPTIRRAILGEYRYLGTIGDYDFWQPRGLPRPEGSELSRRGGEPI